MEGIHSQRATGYTCHMCGDAAIVDFGDAYLCASRAAEARITVDLRAEEPTVTISQGRHQHTVTQRTEDRRESGS